MVGERLLQNAPLFCCNRASTCHVRGFRWLVLVPIISYCCSIDKANPGAMAAFWKWNTSAPLLNVHLLNVVLIAVDFIGSGQPLIFFDYWAAYVVTLLYLTFYLTVLDARGLHFYIILTPRTGYCALIYSAILTLYYLLYVSWGRALHYAYGDALLPI